MSTNKKQSRRVSSKKLRAVLTELADNICGVQDKVTVALTGNTFEIHLEGGSINITINEVTGEAALPLENMSNRKEQGRR